jgi:hypothetical protein
MRFIAIALSAAMAFGPGGGVEKVTICHNGNTITIGAPAVDAHLRNHGDTIGACATGGIGPVEPPLGPPTTTTTLPPEEPPVVVTCQEDEPCWDCETMGNRICGPTVTPTPEPVIAPHSHDELVLRCTVIDEL